MNIFRIGILGIGLVYVFWSVDLSLVIDKLKNYSLIWVCLIVIFSVFVYSILGYRLRSLSHHNLSTLNGLKATIVCHGVNNLLPTKLGEVAKILYTHHQSQLSKAEVTGVVFWERFLDLNMILILPIVTKTH